MYLSYEYATITLQQVDFALLYNIVCLLVILCAKWVPWRCVEINYQHHLRNI